MRLFLAIDLPTRLKSDLSRLAGELKTGRPVDPDTYHITLAFFGDVTGPALDDLGTALETKRFSGAEITLAGLGHFGHSAPDQVWIGAGPLPALKALHDQAASAARHAGIDLPRRRFTPHVTLARLKGHPGDAAAVGTFIAARNRATFDAFRPTAASLFRSHLGHNGPIYEPLADYPLT